MLVDYENLSTLRDCATRIQQIVARYEGLLEFRYRQLDAAAAMSTADRQSQTVADALKGYSADVESYACELAGPVDAFTRAFARLQSSCATDIAGNEAHSERYLDDGRRHIDHLKLARASAELITHAADALLIDHGGSREVRKALSHYRQVVQRYRTSIELLESFSVEMLRRFGVDAAPIDT